jgi:hypothetical protein
MILLNFFLIPYPLPLVINKNFPNHPACLDFLLSFKFYFLKFPKKSNFINQEEEEEEEEKKRKLFIFYFIFCTIF